MQQALSEQLFEMTSSYTTTGIEALRVNASFTTLAGSQPTCSSTCAALCHVLLRRCVDPLLDHTTNTVISHVKVVRIPKVTVSRWCRHNYRMYTFKSTPVKSQICSGWHHTMGQRLYEVSWKYHFTFSFDSTLCKGGGWIFLQGIVFCDSRSSG